MTTYGRLLLGIFLFFMSSGCQAWHWPANNNYHYYWGVSEKQQLGGVPCRESRR